jgi:hypothetical protein
MTFQSCRRCGQLLLPEIVRELGQGKRCPFCNAELAEGAKDASAPAASKPASAARSAQPQAAAPKPRSKSAPKMRAMPAAPVVAAPAVQSAPTVVSVPAGPAARPPLPGVTPAAPATPSASRPEPAPAPPARAPAAGPAPAPAAVAPAAPPPPPAAPRAAPAAVVAPAPAPTPPPAAPRAAPASPPPTKVTVFRASGGSSPAIAIAPSTRELEEPTNPVLTLVPPEATRDAAPERAPRPRAPEPTPAPRLTVAGAQPTPASEVITVPARPAPAEPAPLASAPPPATQLAPVARRPLRALSVALALVGITCFVIAKALPSKGKSPSVPPVTATTKPAAPPPEVSPIAPPADSPPTAVHVAEQKAPAVVPDGDRTTAKRQKGHPIARERRAAHEGKDHRTRGSSKKRGREVALDSAPAPAPAGDDSAARSAYAKGNRLLLTGDTGGAISAYEEATRLAPASPVGYRGLGLAYEKQGNSAEAARAFRQYLKLAPGAEDRALIAERLHRLAPKQKTAAKRGR